MKLEWKELEDKYYYGIKFGKDKLLWIAIVRRLWTNDEWEAQILENDSDVGFYREGYFNTLAEAKKFVEEETPVVSKDIINKIENEYMLDFVIEDLKETAS